MGQPLLARASDSLAPAVEEPDRAHHYAGHHGHGPEGVRDAAMMLESLDRPGESPEDVKVGGFGGQHGSERGVGGLAVESGAAQASAGKEMSDGFHLGDRSNLRMTYLVDGIG